MTSMLATFLTARLDEDEQMALNAAQQVRFERGESDNAENRWNVMYGGYDGIMIFPGPDRGVWTESEQPPVTHHIARHDPARVLREVAAKRDVIDVLLIHRAISGLRAMASVYSDHPDYDPEWSG